jgi:3-hydroxyacyl-[acyl-carrier-protein] dehydratase
MQRLTKDFYGVKELEKDAWEVTFTDETHPVFKAHFEDYPLVPAFLQIDIAGELLSKELSKIERCKFKLPILPNDIVVYKIVKQVENNYKIKIFKQDEEVSELRVVY